MQKNLIKFLAITITLGKSSSKRLALSSTITVSAVVLTVTKDDFSLLKESLALEYDYQVFSRAFSNDSYDYMCNRVVKFFLLNSI